MVKNSGGSCNESDKSDSTVRFTVPSSRVHTLLFGSLPSMPVTEAVKLATEHKPTFVVPLRATVGKTG